MDSQLRASRPASVTGVSHRFSTWSIVRCSDRSRRPASPNCGAETFSAWTLTLASPGTRGDDPEAGAAAEQGDRTKPRPEAHGLHASGPRPLSLLSRDSSALTGFKSSFCRCRGPDKGPPLESVLPSVKGGFELSDSWLLAGAEVALPWAGQWDSRAAGNAPVLFCEMRVSAGPAPHSGVETTRAGTCLTAQSVLSTGSGHRALWSLLQGGDPPAACTTPGQGCETCVTCQLCRARPCSGPWRLQLWDGPLGFTRG